MGGKHPRSIGQLQQFVVQRPVQRPGQRLRRQASVGKKIWATHIADKQRVAGEYAVGHLIVGVLVDNDAYRLGRVSRCRENLQGDLAQWDPLAVAQRLDLELHVGVFAVADPSPGGGRKLQVTG